MFRLNKGGRALLNERLELMDFFSEKKSSETLLKKVNLENCIKITGLTADRTKICHIYVIVIK